jgi:FkbM family methyltransferase
VSIFQAWFTVQSIRFRTRALKALLRDQRAEFGVIRRHVRRGDLVCDIGAYKGSFIYWLSTWVGDGRVVAFEPQPDLARALADVCGVIGLRNVKVEAKAVYSRSGDQELFLPTGHRPGASLHRQAAGREGLTTLSVPVVSLDEYFDQNDRVRLFKIDVEGAELEVLKGAERILRQHAPLLLFECENRHLASGSVTDVFSWLGRLGYRGSFVCRKRILPISEFDAAVHQRADGEWFWKSRDYCNNFVFRKGGSGS